MSETTSPAPTSTNNIWKWGVCGLLLLATMINYMDRLTLNQSIKRVMDEIHFREGGYGRLEAGFGAAFAIGAVLWGWLVDRVNVRWVYPGAVILWSITGAATGFISDYNQLLWCRIALGFFESANWPCAIRTTQRLLKPSERTMGNSILQSGAAVGSIVTPLIILAFLKSSATWRPPFWCVGGLGLVWAVFWLLVVRTEDLSHTTLAVPAGERQRNSWQAILDTWTDRRFWGLICLVVAINATWHFFRAWLPLYLQTGRGYTDRDMSWVMMGYYVAADVGALAAGFATLYLIRRGGAVHSTRLLVYLGFALLALLSIPAAFVSNGTLALVLFLILGFAALGVFPNYYSFTQELSTQHQGKVTGMLSLACWGSLYFIQLGVGKWVEAGKDQEITRLLADGLTRETATPIATQHVYAPLIACAGALPLLGYIAMALFWRSRPTAEAGPRAVQAAVNGHTAAVAEKATAH
jgi:ACS family hexuronate transporter-like MFS transporter